MSLWTRAHERSGRFLRVCPRCHGDDSRRRGLDLARGQKSPKAASFHQIKRCAGHGQRRRTLFSLGKASLRAPASTTASRRISTRKTVRPHTSYNRLPLIYLLCVYSRVAPLLSVVLLLQFRCPASSRYLRCRSTAGYDSLKLELLRYSFPRRRLHVLILKFLRTCRNEKCLEKNSWVRPEIRLLRVSTSSRNLRKLIVLVIRVFYLVFNNILK